MKQQLFNYIKDEHGVMLLSSDIDVIVRIVCKGITPADLVGYNSDGYLNKVERLDTAEKRNIFNEGYSLGRKSYERKMDIIKHNLKTIETESNVISRKIVECCNCGDEVEMISTGEFCPHCLC